MSADHSPFSTDWGPFQRTRTTRRVIAQLSVLVFEHATDEQSNDLLWPERIRPR